MIIIALPATPRRVLLGFVDLAPIIFFGFRNFSVGLVRLVLKHPFSLLARFTAAADSGRQNFARFFEQPRRSGEEEPMLRLLTSRATWCCIAKAGAGPGPGAALTFPLLVFASLGSSSSSGHGCPFEELSCCFRFSLALSAAVLVKAEMPAP